MWYIRLYEKSTEKMLLLMHDNRYFYFLGWLIDSSYQALIPFGWKEKICRENYRIKCCKKIILIELNIINE